MVKDKPEVSDEQIEEITRQIKQEIQSRENISLEQLDEAVVAQESKLKLLANNEQAVKQISVFLITKTSIDTDVLSTLNEEQKYEWLINLTIIHLEWENIYKIEKLEIFTQLQVLYLQHISCYQKNKISKIENLSELSELQYVALDHNEIVKIEGLKKLDKLVFLKLNDNRIEKCDINEIPKTLEYFNVNNNPLIEKDIGYKKRVVSALASLEVLNEENLTSEERFRILEIYPKAYKTYKDEYKAFKEKKEETIVEKPANLSYIDQVKQNAIERKAALMSLTEKYRNITLESLSSEGAVEDLNKATKNIILKQKQKTIMGMNENIEELNSYAQMHANRIDILHKKNSGKGGDGSLSNALYIQNFIENRNHELSQNKYELEKIQIQKTILNRKQYKKDDKTFSMQEQEDEESESDEQEQEEEVKNDK